MKGSKQPTKAIAPLYPGSSNELHKRHIFRPIGDAIAMLFGKKEKSSSVELPELDFCSNGRGGLRAWLDDLPKLNAEALAKQLLNAGNCVSELNCTSEQRVAILDEMEETLLVVSRGLRYRHGHPGDQQLLLVLQQRFHCCFGLLFFRTGSEWVTAAKGGNPLTHSPTGQAKRLLTNAGDFLGRVVLASKQAYSQVPAQCWHALHQSYNLLSWLCDDKTLVPLAAGYKAAIALSCAAAEKLTPQQCEQLYKQVLRNPSLVSISTTAVKGVSFCMDSGSDQQPDYFSPDQLSNNTSSALLYADFADLLKASATDPALIRMNDHLQQVLLKKPTRSDRRIPLEQNVRICHGLINIHLSLSGTSSFKAFCAPFTQLADNGKRSAPGSRSSQQAGDVWGSIYESHWEKADTSGKKIELQMHEASSHHNPNDPDGNGNSSRETEYAPMQTVNASKLGVCLSGKRQDMGDIMPGSLLAYHLPADDDSAQDQWQLATVRWKQQTSTTCTFGLELINALPRPAGIKLKHSQKSTEYLPALILASKQANAAEMSQLKKVLFANTGLHNKSAASLAWGAREQQIVLDQCVDHSVEYNTFTYNEVSGITA